MKMPNIGTKNKGFTLIEVIVAVVLVAIVMAVLVFGFDQTLSRRKDTAVNKFSDWLQASADIAVFQTSVLGVTEEDGRFSLLAFYQDDWYRFNDQEAFIPSDEISIIWSEELVQAQEQGLADSDDLFPYVIIMPTGQMLPEGKITIADQEQTLIAELDWEQDAQFQLSWINEQ